jgi:hypothetical protein
MVLLLALLLLVAFDFAQAGDAIYTPLRCLSPAGIF